MILVCRSCGEKVRVPESVGFRDTCPSCDAYLHACVHCRYFVNDRCTEPAADTVGDPEGQNYCDWFMPIVGSGPSGDTKTSRSEAEDLWKKLTKK